MDNGACSYRRYLEGDEAAFDEIMNELFDNLVFFINRYVGDIHASEDIAIDAFADLIVHKKRYDFRVTLKTYLFMIGRSRALTYVKRRRRHSSLSELTAELPDESVETAFLRDEQKQIINDALSQLSEEMRVAVHLVYLEDMTYDQAACIMHKNRKQIDNLLYRAKKELRQTLGKEETLL